MKVKGIQFKLFISVLISLWLLPAITVADNTIPSVENIFRMSLADVAGEEAAVQERPGSTGDQTGTDPRDFSSKFMPYYRYTELDNGVKINDLTMFGMYAFTAKFAFTYEIPVYRNMDYSSVLPNPPGGVGGAVPPGGGFQPPFSDISRSGSTSGYGDLNLRFFYNFDWGGDYAEEGKSWSLFPVIEIMLPTASDDILGGDTTIISPGITYVTDLPGAPPFGLGFLAFMNFYDFDVDQGDAGQDYSRFRGRWFWMQPLSKPGPSLGDGLYMLTEFQPVYDFETDEFDLWMGPEFGKIIKEGQIMYVKPGWGFDVDPVDRKFTLEVGYRYFF